MPTSPPSAPAPPPPDADQLTVSVIAIDRPRLLAATLANLVGIAPSGATLQLMLNAAGRDTEVAAAAGVARWPGPTLVLRTARRLDFAAAHNHALLHVTTDLVNFMSDDDLSFGPRLHRQLAFLADEPDVLAVGTFAHRIGGDAADPRRLGQMNLGPVDRAEWEATLDGGKLFYYTFPSVVARTAALRAIGGLRAQFGVAADVDLWTRLAERGPILVIPEHLFGFRIHDRAASSTHFMEARRLTRYAKACTRARRAGMPEPSLEQSEAGAGPMTRAKTRLEDLSFYNFRGAGAAWLDGRRATAAWRFAKSFACWPPVAVNKLREQLGTRF